MQFLRLHGKSVTFRKSVTSFKIITKSMKLCLRARFDFRLFSIARASHVPVYATKIPYQLLSSVHVLYLGLKFLKCYQSLSRYIFPPAFNHNFIVIANLF